MRLKRILVLCFLGLALLAPRMEGVETMKKNEKSQCGLPQSEEELRRILTPEQYRIMRQSGTEMPFANAYWNNKKPGIYVDTITGKPLFASVDKFDSGTGWPSFTKPISEGEIVEKADISHSMERTEVRSSSSDSHLGHLFEDGPKPTGQRYCINSAALRFIPVGDLKKEGYGSYLVLFGQENTAQTEIATFGAGCFWGVEEAFRQVKGVVGTAVGYMGGTWENPTYEDVCTDKTGHAEAVRVEFDPAVISYEQLLEVFWNIHDPTTPNRQGPDVGTQYRSVIFFHNPMQMEAALRSRQERQKSGEYKESIVTEIVPAGKFTKAEPYHQRYFEQRGIKPACHLPSNILKKQ